MPLDPQKFTRKSQEAIGAAQAQARDRHHSQVGSDHLLSALIDQPEGVVVGVLERVGVSPKNIRDRVDAALSALPQVYGETAQPPQISPDAYKVLEAADEERRDLGDDYLSTEHLLLAMTKVVGGVGDLLRGLGVTTESVLDALKAVRGSHRVTSENPEEQYQALERFGRDLTEDARRGKLDPVIGRDEEIRRVIQVLSRRTKNNPVLIGEPGVGKTAIAEGLARRIVEGDVPDGLARQAARRRSTSARWSPARSTAASSKSGSRRCSRRSPTPTARSSRSWTSCTRSSAPVAPKVRSTPAT